MKEEFLNIVEVKVSHRTMILKLGFEGLMLNVVYWCVCVPQVVCQFEEKEEFGSKLHEVVKSVPLKENVVIGGDFSGHVGEGNRSDHEVLGR